MRILFDQGTPVPLRRALNDHVVATAYELGWSTVINWDLSGGIESWSSQFQVSLDEPGSINHLVADFQLVLESTQTAHTMPPTS